MSSAADSKALEAMGSLGQRMLDATLLCVLEMDGRLVAHGRGVAAALGCTSHSRT